MPTRTVFIAVLLASLAAFAQDVGTAPGASR
jgi:hypothetical protein